MSFNIKHTHLTASDRNIIEVGINNGSTKTTIAKTLGKDKSTIGKEIKLHRKITHRFSLPLECSGYQKCKYGRVCTPDCPGFLQFKCKRRDSSPGACNGCSNYSHCRFNKYKYTATDADHDYRMTLVESRQGFDLTTKQAQHIGQTVLPLIKAGQSPYAIVKEHPELGICEKTLYTYIESNLFKSVNIDLGALDLRRQVSRKLPKNTEKLYKPRNDYSYLKGRLFTDYLAYVNDHPDARIVQMDTVYNDVSNGPFLQTFKFMKYSFLFAILHSEKTSESMNNGLLLLEKILGPELFNKEVEVLLTDRGSEFYGIPSLETRDDGTVRTRVFYCDPMASCQKGSIENNHIELRYILPKECDLKLLGLDSQSALTFVLSHVNSYPKENLSGKSAFEVLEFFNPTLFEKFISFGLSVIPKNDILLKPILLKSLKK